MKRRTAIAGLAAWLLWSCFGDVTHENPLDPNSDNFIETGIVRGTVTTFYPPRTAVAGVNIELWPGNLNTETDSAGAFSLRNVPVGEYWIIASDPRYAADSARLSVDQEVSARIDFQLNALPQITSAIGRTFHLGGATPEEELYFAHFVVRADDPDGVADVAQVEMRITIPNTEEIIDTLETTAETGKFELQLFAGDLPGDKLHSVLGHPVTFRAIDRLQQQSSPKELIIFRIIDQVPEVISPKDGVVVSATPTLAWQPLSLSFPFDYQVQVDRLRGGVRRTVWRKDGIATSTTAVTVDQELAPDEYLWTVAVVDEFGNASSSQLAAFKIN